MEAAIADREDQPDLPATGTPASSGFPSVTGGFPADKVAALQRAAIALTAEPGVDAVLEATAAAGCELTAAEFAAVFTIGARGEVLSAAGWASGEPLEPAPASWLPGMLLAELLATAHTVAIDHLRPGVEQGREGLGLPGGWPLPASLLAVPISVRNRPYVLLLLGTERPDAFGPAELTAADLLAAQAGMALDGAALFDKVQERGEHLNRLANRLARDADLLAERLAELEAFQSVSLTMAKEERPDQVLTTVAESTRRIFSADLAAILVADGGSLRTGAVSGHPSIDIEQLPGAYRQELARSPVRSHPEVIHDLSAATGRHSVIRDALGGGSAVVAQIPSTAGPLGYIVVASRTVGAFAPERMRLLGSLAALVGSAIKLSAAAAFEERERIGMELHDGVIQQLFATGMALQSLCESAGAGQVGAEGVAGALDMAITDLDRCITDIRRHIYGLGDPAEVPFGDRLRALTATAAGSGIKVSVNAAGEPLPGDDPLCEELLSFAREALSNVVQHSGASLAEVRLLVENGSAELTVIDNGRGFDVESVVHGYGVPNYFRRAQRLRGEAGIESGPGRTSVAIRVPRDTR